MLRSRRATAMTRVKHARTANTAAIVRKKAELAVFASGDPELGLARVRSTGSN